MISFGKSGENRRLSDVPDWIDDELIKHTQAAWEPLYGEKLTKAEAIQILLSVGRLIDSLRDEEP